jgi:hypothetical protein
MNRNYDFPRDEFDDDDSMGDDLDYLVSYEDDEPEVMRFLDQHGFLDEKYA